MDMRMTTTPTRDTLPSVYAGLVRKSLLGRPLPLQRSGRCRVTERMHLHGSLVFRPVREHTIEFGGRPRQVRPRESKEN